MALCSLWDWCQHVRGTYCSYSSETLVSTSHKITSVFGHSKLALFVYWTECMHVHTSCHYILSGHSWICFGNISINIYWTWPGKKSCYGVVSFQLSAGVLHTFSVYFALRSSGTNWLSCQLLRHTVESCLMRVHMFVQHCWSWLFIEYNRAVNCVNNRTSCAVISTYERKVKLREV
jgi:hypothetical protein